MELRDALKQLRKELHFTQTDLADEMHLNLSTVNRWETGKNFPNPSTASYILQIAKTKGASTICQASLKDALFPEPRKKGIDDLKYTEVDEINGLVNNSSNGVLVFNLDTKDVVYANQAALEITKDQKVKVRGMKCYEFINEDKQPCKECRCRAISTETFSQSEKVWPSTGAHFLVRSKKIAWGGAPAIISYFSEITDYVKMRESLQRTQEMMVQACCVARLWAFNLNLKTGKAYLEPPVQEAFKMPAIVENFHQRIDLWPTIMPEYKQSIRDMVKALRNNEMKEGEVDVRIIYSDNSTHWVKYRIVVTEYDQMGKPLMAVCSAQENDSVKAIEAQINYEHQSVLDNNPYLISYIISNLTKNCIVECHTSRDYAPYFEVGQSYDDAIFKARQWIEPMSDRDDFIHCHHRKHIINEYAKGKAKHTMSYQLKCKNGHYIWVKTQLRVFNDPVSGDMYLYEYCFDIQEEKMFDGILSATMFYQFDYIAAISILADQVTTVKPSNPSRRSELIRTAYTDENRKLMEKYISPNDFQTYQGLSTIENITKMLEEQSVYEFAFKTPSKYIKQFRYVWFDKPQGVLMLSVLDVTNVKVN